jgi:hypothetical protein
MAINSCRVGQEQENFCLSCNVPFMIEPNI